MDLNELLQWAGLVALGGYAGWARRARTVAASAATAAAAAAKEARQARRAQVLARVPRAEGVSGRELLRQRLSMKG